MRNVDDPERLGPPPSFARSAVEAPGTEACRPLLRLPRRLLLPDGFAQINPVALLGCEEGGARASTEGGDNDGDKEGKNNDGPKLRTPAVIHQYGLLGRLAIKHAPA